MPDQLAVMIVEDDPEIQALIDEALCDGGYDPALAASGEPVISNRSNTPSRYAVVNIFVDERLKVLSTIRKACRREGEWLSCHSLPLTFYPNKSMPIFKEQPTLMPALGIVVPISMLYRPNDYLIGFEIRSPGCQCDGSNFLIVEYGCRLSIVTKANKTS